MKKKAKKKPAKKLTIMQQRFCLILHSMKTTNQAEAYRLAGYKGTGKTAEQAASRLASNVKVAAYLESLGKRAEARAEKKADEIITELEKLGFSNISDYVKFGPTGITLENSESLTREQLAAIAEVSETETKDGGTQRFKLYDKIKALELLGKRFGLFPNKTEQEITGKDGKPIQINIVDYRNIDDTK